METTPVGSSGGANIVAKEDESIISSPSKKTVGLPAPRSVARSTPIPTPEKPMAMPRRAAKRSVAFSVNQVKKAAMEAKADHRAKVADDCDVGRDGAGSLEETRIGDLGRKPSGADTSTKLPEEYEKLEQLFNSMVTSMRLMRMKGQICTFSNVCPKVEYLTDRRFTHGHLAQMKFILSEAISLKKVLCHNEATSCMKPDIQISVLPDALATKQKKGSDYSTLNKVFHARLIEYFKEHLEGEEIPKVILPEPFNCTKLDQPLKLTKHIMPSKPSLREMESSDVTPHPKLVSPLHMPQTLRFSQKASVMLAKKIDISTACPKLESTSSFTSPDKCTSKSPHTKRSLFPSDTQLPYVKSSMSSEKEEERVKECSGSGCENSSALDCTPSRMVSTPLRLMTATPELQTPKRCWPTADDCTTPVKKSVKRPLSLDEQAELDDVPSNLRFLPKDLLLSIKEKERKANKDMEANLSKAKRRQQMISCLPKLFDMVHFIFQTCSQLIITKQQLVYKIISGNLDIVDRGEIEEQLNLLQELVPDWISERTASTGDIIFSVNRSLKPESIRQMLTEAK